MSLRPLLIVKPKLKQSKRDLLSMLTDALNKTNLTSAFVIPGLYNSCTNQDAAL
jgi:hypothetical protein